MSEAPFDEHDEKDDSASLTAQDACTSTDAHSGTRLISPKSEAKGKNNSNNEDGETASSSSCDDDGSSSIPLFKYARLVGSLPRDARRVSTGRQQPLSEPCTCSAMARVVLPPTASPSLEGSGGMDGTKKMNSGGVNLGSSGTAGAPPQYNILAIGFQSGTLCLVDATTGIVVVPSAQLQVHYTGTKPEPLVDVCFDSSGTCLAAVNASGLVAIWELKYTTASSSTSSARNSFANQDDSVFGFFTRSTSTNTTTSYTNPSARSTFSSSLSCSSIQISRLSYPDSFGPPTCFKLDPAYKKKGIKSLIVGFTNGRVVWTKRGFMMFGRRSDSTLREPSGGSIQALAWRGSLVAWADAVSGIKLYDVESMTRIAHIDRPSGARPSLYPTLSSLKPTLLFESSESFLVAWGDCVMAMSIKESPQQKGVAVTEDSMARAMSGAQGGGDAAAGTMVKKPYHVDCTMAWELDCVACGVVPLDNEHLVVLGLVVPEEDEKAEEDYDRRVSLVTPSGSNTSSSDLEVQVISRLQGNVVHADSLPLLKGPSSMTLESASTYNLLSSYALPRMEDAMEAEEEGFHVEDEDFNFEVSLFQSASSDSAKRGFKDAYTKWSMNEPSFGSLGDKSNTPIKEVEVIQEGKRVTLATDIHEDYEDGAQSEESDDYELLFRPWQNDAPKEQLYSLELPPVMIVTSQSDAVLVRTRDVDDAVAHAIASGKHAVALGRALCFKREIRRYDINDLIDGYLRALLRLTIDDAVGGEESGKKLSIRRVRLAARALPTLLGGNIGQWEKWVSVFSEIPGALFILSSHLPVRDPKLSAKLYEKVLDKMIAEVEGMAATLETMGDSLLLYQQAKDHFLNTLCAWGPTSALKENIRYYSYHDNPKSQKRLGLSTSNPRMDEAETSLLRRLHQTAVGFLEFPISTVRPSFPSVQSGSPLNDVGDSLFRVERLVTTLSPHSSLILPANVVDMKRKGPKTKESHVRLDALAELNLMRGMYEKALQCFLTIGSLHSFPSLQGLEDGAVVGVSTDYDQVIVGSKRHAIQSIENRQYARVIALIEFQHLHFCLLKDDFLSSSNEDFEEGDSDGSELLPPLVALVRLVGLNVVGDFLVEHCIPPNRGESHSSGVGSLEAARLQDNRDWSTTLPLNLVANQFASWPKLLYWFLNLLFERKPEIYVKFPNTAVPPPEIRDLHRTHLELCIEYAGSSKDSVWFASNSKASRSTDEPATPLLKFLKAVLPLGGVRPDEVKRLLEAQRAGNDNPGLTVTAAQVKFPQFYALELAYVMEHYGKPDEKEATAILSLYLKGAKSLSLAAFYAQRNPIHSSLLWGSLLDHCLSKNKNDDDETATGKEDGTLFGSLLEAAALSGADLAHLVTEIPQGMRIEGLRPKLLAAVTDYRLKLQMHEASAEIITKDKISLLLELGHRARRGMRFQTKEQPTSESLEKIVEIRRKEVKEHQGNHDESHKSPKQVSTSLSSLRPSERRRQQRLSFSLPVR